MNFFDFRLQLTTSPASWWKLEVSSCATTASIFAVRSVAFSVAMQRSKANWLDLSEAAHNGVLVLRLTNRNQS